jgi:hypothetical protein
LVNEEVEGSVGGIYVATRRKTVQMLQKKKEEII